MLTYDEHAHETEPEPEPEPEPESTLLSVCQCANFTDPLKPTNQSITTLSPNRIGCRSTDWRPFKTV
ncbi:unnamed protein product [Soboliphyme baturini]|uniref:Cytoplasmic protein n=1 Tax=Soboliphyme baturini TaxID=241478 RepID=A0A183IVC1_9BILA|nr:unnamed protein product [Soboliphyme baturini]